MKTTLLIMTLNEIDGMKAIMPRIDRAWVDQILVIDGGSTDGTVEWARENDYQVHQQKQTSIRMGYKEAWHLIEGDVVMTFSPDGNSIPEKIPEVFAKMREGSEMVVAARYLGDATSDDDDIITGFGNWFYTRTANLLFGANDADVMVIFRAYRKDLIHQLGLLDDDAFNWVERLFGCPYATLSWEPILSVRAPQVWIHGGRNSGLRAFAHQRQAQAQGLSLGGRDLLPVPARVRHPGVAGIAGP